MWARRPLSIDHRDSTVHRRDPRRVDDRGRTSELRRPTRDLRFDQGRRLLLDRDGDPGRIILSEPRRLDGR